MRIKQTLDVVSYCVGAVEIDSPNITTSCLLKEYGGSPFVSTAKLWPVSLVASER